MINEKLESKVIRVGTATSMILGPLLLMVGFALHPAFPAIQTPSTDAASSIVSFRANLFQINLAHFIAFLSLPFLAISGLYLAYVISEEKPWFAIVGAFLTIFGNIFMGGVFGMSLSQGVIVGVSSDQVSGVVPALQMLMDRQGLLMVMSLLAVPTLIGFMILSLGLFLTKKAPLWSSSSVFLGNLIILVFMDIDTLMFLGAVIMLLGFLPLIKQLLFEKNLTDISAKKITDISASV